MPRISAPTVKEHRDTVRAALVDSAERLLRERGPSALTAGAVARQAGIARNSIYRYVETVGDLSGLVIERQIPTWRSRVLAAMAEAGSPAEVLEKWMEGNLQQAADTGFSWLVQMADTGPLSQSTMAVLRDACVTDCPEVREAWEQVAPATLEMHLNLGLSLLNAGMRRLNAGDPISDVLPASLAALRGLISSGH